jgi:FKBP-type peptidyl-prolyl cis-trans isomerase
MMTPSRIALLLLYCCLTSSSRTWIFSVEAFNLRPFDTSSHFDAASTSRRSLLLDSLPPALLLWTSSILHPESAQALVKGNAPPPSSSTKKEIRKCTNVEECQEMAERRDSSLRQEEDPNANPVVVTPQGTRYRDLQLGNGPAVQTGDAVTLYYKVLKLGKRSYDGVSGEGTVIFSRGYGYEEDERAAREQSWRTTVGDGENIDALNDGLVGMRVGSIRRLQVRPDRGWRKPGQQCDGGPGGRGSGGDLKTDYVVVPTATMVAEEACFDATKRPFPVSSYAQQRRMAQRFDQSLILEVEVVGIEPSSS